MRFAWGRLARYLSVFLDARGLSLGVALLLSAAALAFVGGPGTVEAEEYSAYSDPKKPAISFILSDPQNVEEFKEKFGLGAEEIQKVLTAVREENRALAREYAESERLIEANRGLSRGRVKKKIAASDYDEVVKKAVARTKSSIEKLLPEGRRSELKTWVDGQWQQEKGEVQASEDTTYQASGSGKLRCKVFATQYHGYTRYEVALPHRSLKFDGGYRVGLRRGERMAGAPVREVGPWNTYDNYWRHGKNRTMWKDLPRCMPEAQAAYFHNYNNGKDEFGRKVLNPAGVDLTPAVARKLGLKLYQNAWIYVRFRWVLR